MKTAFVVRCVKKRQGKSNVVCHIWKTFQSSLGHPWPILCLSITDNNPPADKSQKDFLRKFYFLITKVYADTLDKMIESDRAISAFHVSELIALILLRHPVARHDSP